MRLFAFAALLACLAVQACSSRPPAPPPPGLARLAPGSAGLRVALTWSAPVDLDLYVTDPTAESVYFANTPTRSGAWLERDARCADRGKGAPAIEVVRTEKPLAGRYRVGVDFIDTCGSEVGVAEYRVVVELDGRRKEKTGSAAFEQFQPLVVELDIERDESGAWSFLPPPSPAEMEGALK